MLESYVNKITRARAAQNTLPASRYSGRSCAAALVGAKVVHQPGFRNGGPPLPDAWLPSDHLPVVAEVGQAIEETFEASETSKVWRHGMRSA